MASRSEHERTALADWPEVDQKAWRAAFLPSHFTKEARRPRTWRDVTRQGIEDGYGCWLAWLAGQHLLDPRMPPETRVNEDRLEVYIATLRSQKLSDYTVVSRVARLAAALSAMAPQADLAWIERGASRLHSAARPLKVVRDYIRPARDLVDLGLNLMDAEGDYGRKGGSYQAVRYRDGLLIAFLIHCPLRRRNLTSLELGRHLEKRGGVWRIDVPAEETKTGVAIRCAWPPALIGDLELYLAQHRPVLQEFGAATPQANRLWISRQGGPMSAQAVYEAVCARTEAAFGRPINPHLFRHIAASDIAVLTPEHYTAVMDILGHSSMGPSARYYNRALMIGAGDRMQATIEAYRNKMI